MSTVKFFPILADLSVASKQHKLPPDDSWKAPQTEGSERKDNYVKGVEQAKWGTGVESADGVVNYFGTQDPQSYHASTASTMTKTYKKFISTMLSAVEYAFNIWKATFKFSGLKINGPVAVGSTGCLKSDQKFFDLFKTYPGHVEFMTGKHYAKWRDAVGKGVEKCLNKYFDNVMVPALPWYPAFAAFPGPVAPPMPNIPWPLISCPSTGLTDITTSAPIKKAILDEFDDGVAEKNHDDIHETIFEAIASSLSIGFLTWVSTQFINLVMANGNIPTFAPPVVPVGPVVNGQNIATPGHIAL